VSRRKNKIPPFVYVTKEMLGSDAYKKLSNPSRVTLLLLRAQLKNNDQVEVKFPYSHAEEYMDRHTFARSIRELEKIGFIRKTQSGGLYRRVNIYTFCGAWERHEKG